MTLDGAAIRVFIALTVPEQAKAALETLVRELGCRISEGVSWVDPEGVHLTLKFLGNVSSHRVSAITQAMDRAIEGLSPSQVGLSGLGVFPNPERPRVLWAGVQGDLASLGRLQAKVDEALGLEGFPRGKRAFNPHLTLGRVRDQTPSKARHKIGKTFTSQELSPVTPWLAEAIHLIQSHLSPSGATYTVLHSTPLGSPEVDKFGVSHNPGS